jgi:hypothetical protein
MKKRIYTFLLILSLVLPQLIQAELPDDFPFITTRLTGTTGEGFVFLAVATKVEGIGYYLIILDNNGTVVAHKKLNDDYAYDFKVQPNGQLSYAQFLSHHSYTGGGNVIHMIMDQDMNVVDSVQLKNGYIAEAHDFQVLPNGHFLAFGYYLTPVDMSKYVDGGHPAAFVSGGIVQELDAERNVVWQWRSWDHYRFKDYPFGGSRDKREYVSKFHLNTIGLDYDGHLLIATPSWIKKINRQTGETIWELGGDQNQFSFIGTDSTDAVDHFTGHAFYLLENGNYLTYDNGGPRRKDPSSEVHEYSLDQENLVATHVWTFAHDSTIGAWHRGNAYRLPNGNTIIGWGGADANPIPAATEVDPDGNIVFEAFFDNPEVESYRAFRFPLDADKPAAQVMEISVYPGEWVFEDAENVTGITVDIDSLTGDGYNSMTVKRYNYAPVYPAFSNRAPLVMAKRVTVETTSVTRVAGKIQFDTDGFNIRNPEDITIYCRENEGDGTFVPLSTEYLKVKKLISAEFDKVGEFIITWPDVAVVTLSATPVSPGRNEIVNQEYPVHIEWAPNGFFRDFHFQVATDGNFNNLVLDTVNHPHTVFEMADHSDNTTYYWRVKILNDGSEGEWSDTASFITSPPAVSLTQPNGEEKWHLGMDYWIKWEDNLSEMIVAELQRAGAFLSVIDTVSSTGAFKWAIPEDMETGEDYSILIRSLDDETVMDQSDGYFSLVDTVSSAAPAIQAPDRRMHIFPNPAGDRVNIKYRLDEYEDVIIRIYDIRGRLLSTRTYEKQVPGDHQVEYGLVNPGSNSLIIELQTESSVMRRRIIQLK